MQAILFYLIYPLIYAIALLPFWALYLLSDFLYYVLRLSGYRKKVVLENLRKSFPEKTEAEIENLSNRYYRYLCDLTLETLKTLTMSERSARERCTFVNKPFLDELYQSGQSFIIVMGHYGNWEWAGPAFSLNTPFQLVVIYRPLSNPYFERMLTRMRTKHGTKICPVKNTLRDMVANRNKLTATAFIADQTATKNDAYWTTFLNQDTAVFTGPEKLAKKFNYPVVYMKMERTRRGHYMVTPELLCREPQRTDTDEISEMFTRRLELDIVEQPTTWLWSHRRWKHKKPAAVPATQEQLTN
ncbi:lysophospholipid acyltransferase family protein [Chryseosolibacter indicus]|uniref:Lysophospholipid acyltransferase family protein n=1 Tax=Chryseosolibacter indicus TaxID=2782351 RepID=A0ABS5VYK8_9BACT|nr:lysophospholipid acyltransferase family protein [Chryseosolibacter indicus]MBT1706386.1 lysophospholipid acyltransferase family protein [Chryseosolibacter indicus]